MGDINIDVDDDSVKGFQELSDFIDIFSLTLPGSGFFRHPRVGGGRVSERVH